MNYVVIGTNEYGDRSICLGLMKEEHLRHNIFKFLNIYFCAKERVKEGRETTKWLESLPNKLEIYEIWDSYATIFPLDVAPDFELDFTKLQELINEYQKENNVTYIHVGTFLDFFMSKIN